MTFQYIRWSDGGAAVYDEDGNVRQLTRCAVHLTDKASIEMGDYINRFGLQDATIDWVLSLIFEMGLREMCRQTDLDRFMCEQEKVNE